MCINCRPSNITIKCVNCGKHISLDPTSTLHSKLHFVPCLPIIGVTLPSTPKDKWYCPTCGKALIPQYQEDMTVINKATILNNEYRGEQGKWEKAVQKEIYSIVQEYQQTFSLPSSFAERMRPLQSKPKPFDRPVPKNKQYNELKNEIFALFHKPLKGIVKDRFPYDRMIEEYCVLYHHYLQKISPEIAKDRVYYTLEEHFDGMSFINLFPHAEYKKDAPVAYFFCSYTSRELIRSYDETVPMLHLKQNIGPYTANLSTQFTEAVLKKYVHDGTALPPQGGSISCWDILLISN